MKVFIPVKKSKVIGYWKDKGKVYLDHLSIVEYNSISGIELEKLRLQYNQIALFIEASDCGIVYYNQFKKDILNNKEVKIVTKKELKKYRDILLNKYNGVTQYTIGKNEYRLVSYYKG